MNVTIAKPNAEKIKYKNKGSIIEKTYLRKIR
jgi:hypothetical protein